MLMRGLQLKSCTIKQGIGGMLEFGKTELKQYYSESLVYRWGVDDWGEGPCFFIETERWFSTLTEFSKDDILERFFRLSLAYRFYHHEGTESLGSGSIEFTENLPKYRNTTTSMRVFTEYVKNSAPYKIFGSSHGVKYYLDFLEQ